MSSVWTKKNNQKINSSSVSSQKIPTESQFKIQSLFLAKSAHDLKNVFITINSTIKNEDFLGSIATESEKEKLKFLYSLCNYGMNLIANINTVNVLDYKNVVDNSEYNLIEVLDFCLTIFQLRQTFENHYPSVKIISEYLIPLDTKVTSINELRLKQVIINLLSNAYKFTKKGQIKLSCTIENCNKVRIKITDTGLGMSKEELQNLFQPFRVVQNDKELNSYGSGLGLCIVKDILGAVSTKLNYSSEKGKGTEFWFELDRFTKSEVIDQNDFITQPLLKMMKDVNAGKKDFLYDKFLKKSGKTEYVDLSIEDEGFLDEDQTDRVGKKGHTCINLGGKIEEKMQKMMYYSKTTHNVCAQQAQLKKRQLKVLKGELNFANGSLGGLGFGRSLSQTPVKDGIQGNFFFRKKTKKYNIFICDDENITAVSTKKLISNFFKRDSPESMPDIYLVHDGIECLYQTYKFYLSDNHVNLILMDQNMPFLNGNVVCSLIKSIRELENTKIFLITSENSNDKIAKEADGFYSKPLKKKDIEDILHLQYF